MNELSREDLERIFCSICIAKLAGRPWTERLRHEISAECAAAVNHLLVIGEILDLSGWRVTLVEDEDSSCLRLELREVIE